MLSKIRAHDKRDEGSSEKGWFGSVKRLHYTFHQIQTNISGTRTNLPGLGLPSQKSRARVKFWFGRANIWYCKVLYTTKFTRAELFGYAYHFYPSPHQKFSVL